MAIKYYDKYPQRWERPSNDYPQGAFKNLSALGEQDGSYLEASWLNDQSGFFGALLRNAEMTPNGLVDTAQRSQFYDALLVCARKAVNLGNYYTKEQVDNKITNELGEDVDKVISQKTVSGLFYNLVDYIELYGVNDTSEPSFNAMKFKECIEKRGVVKSFKGYTYDFTGINISTNFKNILIDLSKDVTTFRNFTHISALEALNVHLNFNIDCDLTPCTGIIDCRKSENITGNLVAISNIRITGDTQSGDIFFGIHYSSNYQDDKSISINIDTLKVNNIIITDPNNGTEYISCVLGNYGSGTIRHSFHNININNIIMKDFYSIDENGNKVVGGVNPLRFFSNPINLTINNMDIVNVGKRVVKTQTYGNINIINLRSKYDETFINNTNFTAMFSLQNSATTNIIRLNIDNVYFDSSNRIRLSSYDSLPHSTIIKNGYMKNAVFFSALNSGNGSFYFENVTTKNLEIIANDSEITISNSNIEVYRATTNKTNQVHNSIVNNSNDASSNFISNLVTTNSEFTVTGDILAGSVVRMESVSINKTSSSRIFRIINGSILTNITVKTGEGIIFDSSADSTGYVYVTNVIYKGGDIIYLSSPTNMFINNVPNRIIGDTTLNKNVLYG